MFRQTSIDKFHAEKATRPVSLALATFGLLAALAVFVLVGQDAYLVDTVAFAGTIYAMWRLPSMRPDSAAASW